MDEQAHARVIVTALVRRRCRYRVGERHTLISSFSSCAGAAIPRKQRAVGTLDHKNDSLGLRRWRRCPYKRRNGVPMNVKRVLNEDEATPYPIICADRSPGGINSAFLGRLAR